MSVPPVEDPLLVQPTGPLDATVRVPGSKSITNRALVCAALAADRSELTGALRADDTEAMVEALVDLGVPISWDDDDRLRVGPGAPDRAAVEIDARQSGTTSRFLLPLLALAPGERRLDGDDQLRDRPMGPSFDALRSLGASVVAEVREGHLPVVIRGPLRSGTARMDGAASSQFLSGLLLSAPSVAGGVRIELTSELVSRPYVDMTLAVMAAFGRHVETPDGHTWVVPEGPYDACTYAVEPDASTASYLFAAAVVTGGRVTVEGLSRDALQGDVAFVDVLERMGARVHWERDAITVAAGASLRGVDVDMEPISDTVPTLAAVAAFASGPSRIRNVGFIRHKESDRIAGPVEELRRCGIDAEETDDGMVIEPGPIRPAVVGTYRDHRMAMAFSLLGLAQPGIRIADPTCVDKTFPGYWDLLAELRRGTGAPARTV